MGKIDMRDHEETGATKNKRPENWIPHASRPRKDNA